ncbi:hypothetical protein S40293_05540 [Stachybotrys chartarum IBT 40293]|nr:hypothetical protein S40293_05540 [Stachybotrys chartarum IBT 40293]
MKFLLHSHFPAGHAYPMQAIAQELVARDHEVVWLTSAVHQVSVEATGATFVPTTQVALIDEPLAKEGATGLLDGQYSRQEGRLLAQVEDYRGILKGFEADVLLVDVFPYGAKALWELGEIPAYATLGVIPMYTSNARSPPAVSGKSPPKSLLGTISNLVQQLVKRLVVLPLQLKPILDRQRRGLGLKALPWFAPEEDYIYSPLLHIQASSLALEFGQDRKVKSGAMPTVFVGPLVAPANQRLPRLPPWWNVLFEWRPVVGITQGTLATDPTSLILPAIQALANSDKITLVVVSPHAAAIAATTRNPRNAHFATFLPYHLFLPRLSLLITNGGYGSITQALAHGVPLLCAGQTEDKKDTAARVAWCGAGIDLKTDTPSVKEIRDAADEILGYARDYKENARQLGRELNGLGGATRACDVLEAFAQAAAEE